MYVQLTGMNVAYYDIILVARTARNIIGYWRDTVVCPSVCL